LIGSRSRLTWREREPINQALILLLNERCRLLHVDAGRLVGLPRLLPQLLDGHLRLDDDGLALAAAVGYTEASIGRPGLWLRSCAMSDEFILVSPKVVIPAEVVMPPVEQAPLPGVTVGAPAPDQVRATEAYFSRQEENHLVAGLMGMWTGTLLLHDLAVEHFEDRDDIEEERERKPAR
jgi:hypothetical protein